MPEDTPAQRHLTDLLGGLDGAEIPGGCDECNAYQTAEPVVAGVWNLRVFHDEWCPFLKRLEARR